MPRPRFARAPVEKRDALLDAAAREFAERGYEDASINRILLAAGFSKGSFYYYFDDKPDLAVAVIEREAARFLELWGDLREVTTAEEFWGEIARVMERGTARLREAPQSTVDAMLRIGTAMSRDPALLARLSCPAFRDAEGKIAAFWKHGQTIGAVRVDLPVSSLVALVQDVKMVAVRILLPHDRRPTNEELLAFGRVHLDLIRRVSEARP